MVRGHEEEEVGQPGVPCSPLDPRAQTLGDALVPAAPAALPPCQPPAWPHTAVASHALALLLQCARWALSQARLCAVPPAAPFAVVSASAGPSLGRAAAALVRARPQGQAWVTSVGEVYLRVCENSATGAARGERYSSVPTNRCVLLWFSSSVMCLCAASASLDCAASTRASSALTRASSARVTAQQARPSAAPCSAATRSRPCCRMATKAAVSRSSCADEAASRAVVRSKEACTAAASFTASAQRRSDSALARRAVLRRALRETTALGKDESMLESEAPASSSSGPCCCCEPSADAPSLLPSLLPPTARVTWRRVALSARLRRSSSCRRC